METKTRFAGVTTLGVDEHLWHHVDTRKRGPKELTGMVDLTRDKDGRVHARLLDLVPGRSGTVYKTWLDQRGKAFKAHVEVATLDPFRGYKNAIDDKLADATAVLDAFHVVALAGHAVDEVRRRVQRGDPWPPWPLRRAVRHPERVCAVPPSGSPTNNKPASPPRSPTTKRHDEVHIAWQCAQRVRAAYAHPDPARGRQLAEQVVAGFVPPCPIPRSPTSAAPPPVERRLPGLLRHQPSLQRRD